MVETKGDKKLKKFLKPGLQKQLQRGALAEIYSVGGPERVRESAAGGKTFVRPLLDPRLSLTVQERATGNCYGAYFEQAHTGGSSEFLREFVDGGSGGSGGYSEKQATVVGMVRCAQEALSLLPPARYSLGGTRKNIKRGRHLPVYPQMMIDAVCVSGYSLTFVAVSRQWVVYRQPKGNKGQKAKATVPDRQRKALLEALKINLNTIANAWLQMGYQRPFTFGEIEGD